MADPRAVLKERGFVIFDHDPRVALWATQAHTIAKGIVSDAAQQRRWLRHGQTWFVGVDALPNDAAGTVGGAPLLGGWQDLITPPATWHPAQLSVVYREYPKQDVGESDGAHRYRIKRAGAHVDGLHLEEGRRIVRECHSFILGLPLVHATACPLVVWPESHLMMRDAFREIIGSGAPLGADVTEIYKATREAVFERCPPQEITIEPGQAVLLDRHLLHGIAADDLARSMPEAGRMTAYFRPHFADPMDWLRD